MNFFLGYMLLLICKWTSFANESRLICKWGTYFSLYANKSTHLQMSTILPFFSHSKTPEPVLSPISWYVFYMGIQNYEYIVSKYYVSRICSFRLLLPDSFLPKLCSWICWEGLFHRVSKNKHSFYHTEFLLTLCWSKNVFKHQTR